MVLAQGTVIRSHEATVSVDNHSAVLENSRVVGTSDHPVAIGQRTVFGHRCQVIGARIGNLCEIGNGTILMPEGLVARTSEAHRANGIDLRVLTDLESIDLQAGTVAVRDLFRVRSSELVPACTSEVQRIVKDGRKAAGEGR